ncbi:peptidase domain-containing ABC transporter [Aeromonas lusitana]|uniref:ABC transporter ATP-binding protein n=1 Tax=Aeromonas lusitana TaxID=931529 RepID=A0A2M8HE50_9GAMM|nr:peptidase domain-containing ABC transporter [Aeromonas lusitana]PJC94844.1 hypothetical protein CUC44_02580 [Aeromonas lusitana]
MDVKFFSKNKLPIFFQSELSECGLACIAMIASYHGHKINTASIRKQFNSFSMGAKLRDLMDLASQLYLLPRALRVDLHELGQLKMPCILHWNMNHYVVLADVKKKHIIVHDPAIGKVKVPFSKVSESFTGVALELTKKVSFEEISVENKISFRDILEKLPDIKSPLIQIIFLSFFLEAISIIPPLYMQFIIDGVLLNSDRELLLTIIISSLAILAINVIIQSIRSWAALVLSVKMNLSWMRNIFHHLLSLPIYFFEKRQIGDISSRFSSSISIQQTLTNYFIESLLDGIMALGTLVLMLLYSYKLAIISICSLVGYTFFRLAWYSYLKEITEEQLVISAQENSYFIETLRGIQSIKSYKKTLERESAWFNILINQTNIDVRLARFSIAYKFINTMFFGIAQSMTLWVGASLVIDSLLSIGMYMAFMSYSSQFTGRMSSLIDNIISLKMISLHIDRLSDIVSTEPERTGICKALPCDKSNIYIEFVNVYFRYSDDSEWVLNNVSFNINSGEVVAITGPSGCGKSTVIKLLMGFYYPQAGEVLIQGVSTKDIDKDTLRDLFSCVMQDDFIFSGSIMDNIAFMDDSPNTVQVVKVAKQACIDTKITSLPMGYNTIVGDIGCPLSGGQKQRIILARALYKNASVFLFDEATSNLDKETEKNISDVICNSGVTTILVAHRDETIRSADRVIDLSA